MLNFSDFGNMANIIKQAKQFQDKFTGLDDKLKQILIEAESAGGMVKVVMNCKNQIISIDIDESLMTVESKNITSDLIVTAINNAYTKVEEKVKQERGKIMQDLGLPPQMSDMF